MGTISYRVGELRQLVRESALQYSPVKGPGVDADNKRNNEKSYKDAEKAAKDYDGGLQPEKKGALPDKIDGNRTTLDYNPRTEPDKAFKDKVDAQAKGYTSKLEEENGIEKGGAVFDKEGKIKKNFEKASDKANEVKHDLAVSGIQGNNLKDENKKKETMYEQAKPKAKRLEFKHTKFLNEEHMLDRIPEEYKIDGQRIYMKDREGSEYIVECEKSSKTGLIEVNIVGYNNSKKLNEQLDRINQLFNYRTENEFAPSTAKERIEENDSFKGMMDLSRSLIK
jgi:hypothetical protein